MGSDPAQAGSAERLAMLRVQAQALRAEFNEILDRATRITRDRTFTGAREDGKTAHWLFDEDPNPMSAQELIATLWRELPERNRETDMES